MLFSLYFILLRHFMQANVYNTEYLPVYIEMFYPELFSITLDLSAQYPQLVFAPVSS